MWRSCPPSIPTGPFTNLEPENPSINVYELHDVLSIGRILNLWKGKWFGRDISHSRCLAIKKLDLDGQMMAPVGNKKKSMPCSYHLLIDVNKRSLILIWRSSKSALSWKKNILSIHPFLTLEMQNPSYDVLELHKKNDLLILGLDLFLKDPVG